MQLKPLNKIQTGPRLLKCPVCGKYTARVTSTLVSSGKVRQKIVCSSSSCHSERYV